MKRCYRIVFSIATFAVLVSGSVDVGAVESTTVTTVGSSSGNSTTRNSTYIMPAAGSGGNAAASGRGAQSAQLIGAAVNIGAAGMYMAYCPKKTWACALAGMASAASGILGGASGGSGAAGAEMSAFDPSIYGYGADGLGGDKAGLANGSTITLPDGTNSKTLARDLAKIRASLANAGASISADGKTLTMKDGRKFDLGKGADGSADGLLAMGLSAAEAADAMDASKKIGSTLNSKYGAMAAKISADGGGGGGGRSPASDTGSDGGPFGNGFNFDDPNKKREREKPKVSGLTRKFGEDTIGVSGDNIFEMVTRRYKARDQVNQFLKD